MTTAPDLLDEYGQALSGDWAQLDGRSAQVSLEKLADTVREYGNEPLPDDTVTALRNSLDLCPIGNGHWAEHCARNGCTTSETT